MEVNIRYEQLYYIEKKSVGLRVYQVFSIEEKYVTCDSDGV
jgi:hypothetical protein